MQKDAVCVCRFRQTAQSLFGEATMKFDFQPISIGDAEEIVGWRHPEPYHLYDVEDATHLLNPAFHYYVSRFGQRVSAFLCYGEDARVRGFDYDDSYVDVGWGLRPDLTDQGLGKCLISQVMGFMHSRTERKRLRATVMAFNERCQKACRSAGFICSTRFVRPSDGRRFVVMTEKETEQAHAADSTADARVSRQVPNELTLPPP